MNVFFRELKYYRKGLIFWSLGMVLLVWSSMVKYSTFKGTGQSAVDLVGQFPQSVQTIFGLTGFDLNTVSGFYGVIFMYSALTATMHAVLLGAGIVSKEERDKTSEFLFVKPITRDRIVSAKIMAGLVNLLVINLVTLASSIYYVDYYSNSNSTNGDVMTMMVGLGFLQLIFFAIGLAIAAVSKVAKASVSMASAVLLTTFILTYIINLNSDLDLLKYLTPFKYFDARDILSSGLNGGFMVLSLVIIGVLTLVTYRSYTARDLDV